MQPLHEQMTRVLESNPDLLAAAEATRGDGVDGGKLLREIEAFITRYIVVLKEAALPLALWAIFTFMFDAFDAVPYLVISSPAPRCGKTRLLECLELVVAGPRRAENISEAALFRSIEKFAPTLILDEAETLNNQSERSEYLRQILNAGNRRGAVTTRCVGAGANIEVKDFSVFCPKIVSGIGSFPSTITDRSIVISMQRRKASEPVERFLYKIAEPAGRALRESGEIFAASGRSAIAKAYEQVDLQFLSDRDAEAWAPLFSILAVADPGRLGELRTSAERLCREKVGNAEDDYLPQRLLADLRDVWKTDERYMLTAELLASLKAIEDSPWAAEVELNARKLSRMLRPFEVCPGTVRASAGRGKGYDKEDLNVAFSRYLAPKR